jgi:hypothetical protein
MLLTVPLRNILLVVSETVCFAYKKWENSLKRVKCESMSLQEKCIGPGEGQLLAGATKTQGSPSKIRPIRYEKEERDSK